MVAGLRGLRFYVDKTLRHSAAEYEAELGRPAEQFIELLRAKGIASAEELS